LLARSRNFKRLPRRRKQSPFVMADQDNFEGSSRCGATGANREFMVPAPGAFGH
jgi:hypothetical protein